MLILSLVAQKNNLSYKILNNMVNNILIDKLANEYSNLLRIYFNSNLPENIIEGSATKFVANVQMLENKYGAELEEKFLENENAFKFLMALYFSNLLHAFVFDLEEILNIIQKKILVNLIKNDENLPLEQLKQSLILDVYKKLGIIKTFQISPLSKIELPIDVINCNRIKISGKVLIGEQCTLFSNVSISGNIIIKNNVTLCENVHIPKDVTIEDNCIIERNCIVLENLEKNSVLKIITQQQIKQRYGNSLQSQKVYVYGIVPKFKNTFIILGEGFYNPTIFIKLKNEKTLNYTITYWDKNKIIVKIKSFFKFTNKQVDNVKVTLFSNSEKLIILNSVGLEKCLLSLQKD